MVYVGESYVVRPPKSVLTPFQAGSSCKWTNDGQRFLLKHFDALRSSPCHIYHSALPLSPSSSWLRECYSAYFSQEVKVVKGLPTEWGPCSRAFALDSRPQALACWRDTVAAGLTSGDIVILAATTGSRVATFSVHTRTVGSLVFSPDGKSLVSRSVDGSIRLWDMQTGGVVNTFYNHTNTILPISTVSISSDCTTIASGFDSRTTHLWNIRTGECHRVIKHQGDASCISFSPTDPCRLILASNGEVRQWDVGGHQIGPTYDGYRAAYSFDGTQFVSCKGAAAEVRDSDSGAVVTKLSVANGNNINRCCFSLDGRLVAFATRETIYVWDIAGSDPHLAKTFVDHTSYITSFAFSSNLILISTTHDRSVRFWQIGALSTDQVATNPRPTPLVSTPIKSVGLQARDGIAISLDSAGLVRTWDLSTGLCESFLQTPAEDVFLGDARVIGGRLVVAWCDGGRKIHIWDTVTGGLPRTVDVPNLNPLALVVSGDGSKVFLVGLRSVQARSTWTGEVVGGVRSRLTFSDPSCMEGSRLLVRYKDSSIQGWDFGIPGSPPISLFGTSLDRSRLDFIRGTEWMNTGPARVEDTVTGKEVFRLSGEYAQPTGAQWDGRYLIAYFQSGEVLILDFDRVLPR